MQEVYDRVVVGDLPGLNPVDGAMPRDGGDSDVHIGDENPLRVLRTRALYAPPEELRIWINRWRDTDGDLHDDAFVYVLVGEGQWLVRD